MRALTKILAGGAFVAALVSAAPASAQYYPGYGYGYGGGGNVIGQVLNQVLGGGVGYGGYGNYGGYGGYGVGNQQAAVSQCAAAVQQRLGGGYGGYGYNGGYGGYGNNGYNGGGGRVLGISRVEPRSGGGVTVRGVASSGGYAGYGYGYNGQGQADLTFKCKADYRGFVTSVSLDRINGASGYNYSPYGQDYSQYGYRRY
jgi:hypothetical protein